MIINATFVQLRIAARKFLSARGGNVAVIFALAVVPLVAAAGAAIDYSHANSIKAAMQEALDSTALALVKTAASTSSDQLTTSATNDFKANFNRPDAQNVQISASYDNSSGILSVSGSAVMATSLLRVAGLSSIPIGGLVKAKLADRTWPVCVMVTSPDQKHTLLTQDNAKINFYGCMVQVNTDNWDAVEARDTSYIHSTNGDNCYVGDIHYGDITPPKDPVCNLMPDPYAGYTMPASASTCTYTGVKVTLNDTVLNPGTYCNGLTIQNVTNVTFNPGQYIISGNVFQIQGPNSMTNVTASGVTFLLTGHNSGLNLQNVNFNITPATNIGAYSGFLFFLDQTLSGGKVQYGSQSTFNNVQMNTSGIIYLVGQQMLIKSNSVITINPGAIMADFILPTDNSILNLTSTLGSSVAAEQAMQKKSAVPSNPVLVQ